MPASRSSACSSARLGLEALAEELVDIAPFPGRRVATLVHAMVAGADCIDDADVLRAGATGAVLPHKVMAPSTLGTFLRCFDFGHIRQLDQLAEAMLTRAWSAARDPGRADDGRRGLDDLPGARRREAGRRLRLHPRPRLPPAARDESRHGRGPPRPVPQGLGGIGTGCGALRPRARRTVPARRAAGPLTLRADSGFYSRHVVKACRDHDVRYSITAPQNPGVQRAIVGIDEESWIPIDYTEGGEAWVAETTYGDGHRLVVRRTRLADPQPALFPVFRYHAFITDRGGNVVALDADHRRHAVIELAIRDLKEGSGLAHCPSGRFGANGAWAVLSTIAHNLLRWVAALGLQIRGPIVAKTVRRRFLALPGRITHRARHRQLHLPANWPWAEQWTACFTRLYALRA